VFPSAVDAKPHEARQEIAKKSGIQQIIFGTGLRWPIENGELALFEASSSSFLQRRSSKSSNQANQGYFADAPSTNQQRDAAAACQNAKYKL
jgi:hypothetical protein